MGDINATEIMAVNSQILDLVTAQIRLEIALATVSQKHDVLRERQPKHWDKRKHFGKNAYDGIYRYYRI